jgi:hypothetical protein
VIQFLLTWFGIACVSGMAIGQFLDSKRWVPRIHRDD